MNASQSDHDAIYAKVKQVLYYQGFDADCMLKWPEWLLEVGLTPAQVTKGMLAKAERELRAEFFEPWMEKPKNGRNSDQATISRPYNKSDGNPNPDQETTVKTIKKADAVRLMTLLGHKTASKWTTKILSEKLKVLPDFTEDDRDKLPDDDSKALFDELVVIISKDGQITIKDEDAAEEEAPKKGKGKKEKAENPDKAESHKKNGKVPKEKKEKGDKAPSNKEVVYKAWVKGKDKTTAAAEGLLKLVGDKVKITSVKGWIGAWNRGNNLPACAK